MELSEEFILDFLKIGVGSNKPNPKYFLIQFRLRFVVVLYRKVQVIIIGCFLSSVQA
jgi:hypothetical protein